MDGTRRDWAWGVVANAAEMESVDEAWWLSLTPAERVELVAQLSASFDWSDVDDEDDGAVIRLLGPDCGVRG